MNQINTPYQVQGSQAAIDAENARFMNGVYRWMTFGLFLTGCIAFLLSENEQMMMALLANKLLFWGIIIVQLGSVFYLAARINKMSPALATGIYVGYAALTGVTFSSIFLIYTTESIQNVFFLTSFAFAGLSFFGLVTKRDLGPIGTFCTMGLFGLIGFGLLSMFFPSMQTGKMGMIYSIGGVIIFAGLTAYDTQKIKNSNIIGNEGTAEDHKETIMGALTLYLDFINLFLLLLRLMGDRRR